MGAVTEGITSNINIKKGACPSIVFTVPMLMNSSLAGMTMDSLDLDGGNQTGALSIQPSLSGRCKTAKKNQVKKNSIVLNSAKNSKWKNKKIEMTDMPVKVSFTMLSAPLELTDMALSIPSWSWHFFLHNLPGSLVFVRLMAGHNAGKKNGFKKMLNCLGILTITSSVRMSKSNVLYYFSDHKLSFQITFLLIVELLGMVVHKRQWMGCSNFEKKTLTII